MLWPAFDRALGAFLKGELEPLLRGSSPAAVDGCSFEALSFGATPMQVCGRCAALQLLALRARVPVISKGSLRLHRPFSFVSAPSKRSPLTPPPCRCMTDALHVAADLFLGLRRLSVPVRPARLPLRASQLHSATTAQKNLVSRTISGPFRNTLHLGLLQAQWLCICIVQYAAACRCQFISCGSATMFGFLSRAEAMLKYACPRRSSG